MRAGRADGGAWLRLGEAAAALGVSLNTLRRWSDSGKLRVYRSPGGHRRYRRSDVEALLQSEVDGPSPSHPGGSVGAGDDKPSDLPPTPLLALAQVAANGIGVDGCRVLFDRGEGAPEVVAEYGAPERLAPGEAATAAAPLAGKVLQTGRRLIVPDVAGTTLLSAAEADECRRRGCRALLVLPITAGGHAIGVLDMSESRGAREFAAPAIAFAEFIARQAATMLSSGPDGVAATAGVPAVPAGEATLPAAAVRGILHDTSALLRDLASRLRAELDVVACDVLALDHPSGELTLVASAAAADATPLDAVTFVPHAGGDVAQALSSEEHAAPLGRDGDAGDEAPATAGARSTDPFLQHRLDGARGVLWRPLRAGHETVGLLGLFTRAVASPLDQGRRAAVDAAAAIAGLALAGEERRTTLAARAAEFDELLVGLAEREPADDALQLAHTILQAVVRDSDGSTATVYRFASGVASVALTLDERDGSTSPEAWSIDAHPDAAQAIAERRPVVFRGRADERSPRRAGGSPATHDADVIVLTPLLYLGECIGLLEVGAQPGADATVLERISWTAAQLLAVTLGSGDAMTHLLRRSRGLELVIETSLGEESGLGTEEVLRTVSHRLADMTSAPVVDVYAVEGSTLRALVSFDGGRFDAAWEGVVIPLARYPSSRRAVETGDVAVVTSLNDPLLDPDGRHALEKWGYQCQLSLPLTAGGRVLGLIELSDYAPRDFSRDLTVIRGLGRVAAHALEKAALRERIQRRSRVLNELVELGALAGSTRDQGELVRAFAQRLLTVVDAGSCDIFQVCDEGLRCVASYDRSGFDERAVGRLLEGEDYPTAVEAMWAHQVLVISGPDDAQLTERERQNYREHGFASEVCVPLAVGDQTYGLIDIYDTREREYNEYLSFLKSAAHALAGALESSLLLAQLERRAATLRQIVEQGGLLSRTRDLRSLLGELASRLRDHIQAADCDIFALQDFRLRCLVSADRDGLDESVVGSELDMDKFPATAMAVRSGEAMAVTDLDDPRLTAAERRDMERHGFQSEFCLPLVSGDNVIGLIDVFDTRPRDYGEYFDLIRSVGHMAASAIENAGLVTELERRNRALAELVELGQVVAGSGDLDQLVRAVGARVVDLMDAAGCQVFVLQDGRLHCVLTYDHGEFQDDYVGRPLDLDLFPSTRTALERRETLVVQSADDPRLSDYERGLYVDSGSQSEVAVPLIADDRVVGLLDVYDERARDYVEHLDFLSSVAQIIAGAFATGVLLERLEATNATLQTMVESGIEFGSSLDLEAVLQSVARRLCALTEAPTCDICTVDGQLSRCIASVDHGEPDRRAVGAIWRLEDLALLSQALLTRTPIIVADLATDSRVSEHERAEGRRRGHRSRLDLPLVSGGAVIGFASLFDDHAREFADVDLLHSLAQVAANALANAALFERLDRSAARMALLSDVSFELTSSLELQQVLRSAAQRLCEVSGFPVCDVYRLRDDTLVNLVSVEDGEVDEEWLGREMPLSAWTSLEAAITTRRPQSITSLDDPRLSAEERRLMEMYDQTADLVIPLMSRERVIGVLELLDKGVPKTPSEEELSTIVAVSRVAALAIDNADLVDDLQQRNRENELLNEIARATSASLNLGDIAAGALEKLQRLTPFARGMVALARHDGSLEVAYVTPARTTTLPRRISPAPAKALLTRLRDEGVTVFTLPDDLPQGFVLPGLDGLRSAVAVLLHSGGRDIGVLALGADSAGVFDAVDRRPLERVATHLALAINNAGLYEGIKHLHLSNLKALSSALNAKDYYTLGHAARVAAYMVLLGEELGWAQELTRQVEEAAYLHDIGKIGVSDRVLLKPSGLNSREWELMRQHPIFSADIISPLFEQELILGVRHHHERFDGSGYPDGLAGMDIPLIARAMCVADSYDAMSFRRPYRQAHSYPECLEELARCSGSQFDPDMVSAFTRVLGRIAAGRERAAAVAADAAARIDVDKHAALREPDDESRPEYLEIVARLRDVCRANPPTRFISTHVRMGKKTTLVAGCGPNGAERPHIGDVVYSDDELLAVFEGRHPDANVLFVDQRGVWISGSAPLLDSDGTVVAVVSADIPATGEGPEVEGLPSNVAQTFAAMLDTAAAQAGRSEVEAITDGLTGLYNHRYFHERLSEEIERAVEAGTELALLFCDLDDFRAFNEFHGHGGGDHALRTVARIIEASVRHVDLAARYGGEEFAAILIDTGERGALEVAERIRAGIAEADLTAGSITLSVSIGVATCPADATFKEELIDKADWAMYLAKRRGRDKVMTFGAQHGSDTPEQAATVGRDYVATMSELVTAREAYERQRRTAITHIALAVGRELGLDAAGLRALATASAAPVDDGVRDGPERIIALAAAYQGLVAERPYRPQISEAEALDELLACPALMYDRQLAAAFRRVLSGAG